MFEKLLSGMFLGEVTRRILLSMASDPTVLLFGGCDKSTAAGSAAAGADPVVALKQPNVFGTPDVAACASDRTLRLMHVWDVLRRTLGVEASYAERRAVSGNAAPPFPPPFPPLRWFVVLCAPSCCCCATRCVGAAAAALRACRRFLRCQLCPVSLLSLNPKP
eukprot:93895-Chlamydomonas_euryale.AAC.4